MAAVVAVVYKIVLFVLKATAWVLPWFLMSILLATLVNALKLDGLIKRAFDNRVGLAIVAATAVGAFSPFCSCTVVPIVAGLLSSGVPLAPVMAFWIASPSMDPEIYPMTVAILGVDLANVRLFATLALSLAAGFGTLLLTRSGFFTGIEIMPKHKTAEIASDGGCCEPETDMTPHAAPLAVATNACCDPKPISRQPAPIPAMAIAGGPKVSLAPPIQLRLPSADSSSCCAAPISSSELEQTPWQARIKESFQEIKWPQIGVETLRESWRIGKWILLAFVLEALIVQFVPQEVIVSSIGGNAWWAVPLAASIGVPLYMTNLSALPIISGLLSQGMQPGAAIAFLVAGPVTTIPAMTAVYGIVHRRIFIVYLFFGMVGAILLGYLTNLII